MYAVKIKQAKFKKKKEVKKIVPRAVADGKREYIFGNDAI